MSNKPQYLMESPNESKRLKLKTDAGKTIAQLYNAGFHKLKNGAKIVDAGSGSGIVSKLMHQELLEGKKSGTITLLDLSEDRLNSAKQLFRGRKKINVNFLKCDLKKIPLPTNSQDFVFSRFVFEYLSNPKSVFKELCRITKKGGKIVISDLDYNCLTHYPLPIKIESNLIELSKIIHENSLLDPWIGRKIYYFFIKNKLKKIKVSLDAHHLFFGKLKKRDLGNWTAKLNQLIHIQKTKELPISFNLNIFKNKFLKFLKSKDRFSYTPIITVEGIK